MAMKFPQHGITLVEVIVYVALLAIVSTTLLSFGIQILKVNSRTQKRSQVLASTWIATDAITNAIRHADALYTPTSVFTTSPGQLSLVTKEDLPTDETTTYVDFYLDNNRLYRKQEGVAAQAITPEQLKITNLVFTNMTTGSVPSVKIQMTVAPNASDPAIAKESITVATSASFRNFAP